MKMYRAYGYEPGGSTPHAGFCDSLNVAMDELNNALTQIYANGWDLHPSVGSAVAVYDANADFWTRKWFTIPFTSQCEDKTKEVRAAVESMRALIAANSGGTKPPLLRPEFKEEPGGPFGSIPLWVKLAGGGIIAVLLLGQVTTIASAIKATRPRLSGTRKVRR